MKKENSKVESANSSKTETETKSRLSSAQTLNNSQLNKILGGKTASGISPVKGDPMAR